MKIKQLTTLKHKLQWLLLLAALLGVNQGVWAKTLAFKAVSGWYSNGAWTAAYFYGGDGEYWSYVTNSIGNDYYTVEVPGNRTNVIFVRMKSGSDINCHWNCKWNQTGDLSVSDGCVYNVSNVNGSGSWDKCVLVRSQVSGGKKGTYYVGDKLNGGSDWTYYYDICETTWNSSEVRVGKTTSSYTSVEDAHNQDLGSYGKQRKANLKNVVFTEKGTWYAWGAARKTNDVLHSLTAAQSTWTNSTSTTLGGNQPSWTVDDIPNPTGVGATTSGSTASISWTPWSRNSTNQYVLIVRYSGSPSSVTAPTNGTSYSVEDEIGTSTKGTVIYKGNSTSTSDEDLSDGNYKYYLYTINNNYYSSGVSTTVTIASCTKPTTVTPTYDNTSGSKTVTLGSAKSNALPETTAKILAPGASGGSSISYYNWSSTNSDFAEISNSSAQDPTIKFKREGKYTITSKVGCGSSSGSYTSGTVVVNVLPNELFIVGPLVNSTANPKTWDNGEDLTRTYTSDTDISYTRTWVTPWASTATTNKMFGIRSIKNYGGVATSMVGSYAYNSTKSGVAIDDGSGGSGNIAPNITYEAGDHLSIAVTYKGWNTSQSKPEYTYELTSCTPPTPTTTNAPAAKSYTTATLTGTYPTTSGYCSISEKGICYGADTNPTDKHVDSSSSSGSISMDITGLTPGETYHYRAYVVVDGKTYYGADKSFITTACSNPTVSTQPSDTDREYCINAASPATLTVEASGGVGEYTYQWKQCATSGGSYTNVSAGSGGTTDTYTPSTATAGGLYYKCVVTNKDICTSNSVTSNASGKYTINAPSATGNLKVGDASPVSGTSDVCKGAANSTVTLSTTSNVGTTYKWEQYANSTWSQVGTDATYGAPISSVGSTQYRLSVKNGACEYSIPTTVTVRVNPVPSGTTITGSSPVCAGTTGLTYSASSTAVAGSTYSYAWEVTGTDWNITSVASSSTATMTAGTANGTVKVTPTLTTTASGKACAGSQVTKSVTVNTVPTISLTASPSSVYPWEYSTITATTTCTTLVWKLYQGGSLISTGAGSGANYSFARVSDTQYKLKGISSSGSGSSVTYTVKVDGSNANCDANQSTNNITINPKATESCGD